MVLAGVAGVDVIGGAAAEQSRSPSPMPRPCRQYMKQGDLGAKVAGNAGGITRHFNTGWRRVGRQEDLA